MRSPPQPFVFLRRGFILRLKPYGGMLNCCREMSIYGQNEKLYNEYQNSSYWWNVVKDLQVPTPFESTNQKKFWVEQQPKAKQSFMGGDFDVLQQ